MVEYKKVVIGDITIGEGEPLALIGGPCVIESEESVMSHAKRLKEITARLNMPFVFKSSYDKANRSSVNSFRGPGLDKGLSILKKVKDVVKVKILSDVHDASQVKKAAEVLDIIQIPAFLARQTDLLVEAGKTGKAINVKKGQFMSPEEMTNVVAKLESAGNKNILLTERGTFFGYNMLVNDFRSIPIMKNTGYPVIFDATHSVQRPAGRGTSSGGDSKFIFTLAKAAVACGANALFLEIHENPDAALSDGPNMLKLSYLEDFIVKMKKIAEVVRE